MCGLAQLPPAAQEAGWEKPALSSAPGQASRNGGPSQAGVGTSSGHLS